MKRVYTTDLMAWVRDLEEEVATLKRQLKTICGEGKHPDQHWHELPLTPSEERILRVLLIRDFVPAEALEAALYWDKNEIADKKCIAVFMSHIRRKLPFLKPWLKSKYGGAYYLSPEGKHRLLFELKNPGLTQQTA